MENSQVNSPLSLEIYLAPYMTREGQLSKLGKSTGDITLHISRMEVKQSVWLAGTLSAIENFNAIDPSFIIYVFFFTFAITFLEPKWDLWLLLSLKSGLNENKTSYRSLEGFLRKRKNLKNGKRGLMNKIDAEMYLRHISQDEEGHLGVFNNYVQWIIEIVPKPL